MKRTGFLMVAMLCLGASAQPAEPPAAYMVWDKTCIQRIELTEATRMEAPLLDGKPDMKRIQMRGQLVTFDPKCGRIEIRK
jgi:hypothetical protein